MKPTLYFQTLRSAISRKNPLITALIKINHPSVPKMATKRLPLNVVFTIDVSGSMAGTLRVNNEMLNQVMPPPVYVGPAQPFPSPNAPMWPNNPNPISPNLPGWPNNPQPTFGPMIGQAVQLPPFNHMLEARVAPTPTSTKLERVKQACIKAIEQLTEADRFGVVTFDSNAKVVVASVLATREAKDNAIREINRLQPGSSTALHAGWKLATEMVCKHLDNKQINRVLLLTDGEATDGIRDATTLGAHAAKMAQHQVSTSTFGVGDQFNEDLLQAMAEKGEGRSYYLEASTDFAQLFNEEFVGMTRRYGTNVKLRGATSAQADVELMNDLEQTTTGWKLPNAIYGKEDLMVLKITPKLNKGQSKVSGTVTYEWVQDPTQPAQTVDLAWEVEIISETARAALPEVEQVAITVLELEVARAKAEALKALDRGDLIATRSILDSSKSMLTGSAYAASASLMSATARLDTLMSVGASGDTQKLRKMSSFDAYETRNSYTTPTPDAKS